MNKKAILPALLALLAVAPAAAQYTYDPSAADELDKPGNLYFGSARDERGAAVPDVMVILETTQTNFTLVTDEQGRFRARLPLDTLAASVKASCSRPGYVVVRVTKRQGPKRANSPVQVDCLLKRQGAR